MMDIVLAVVMVIVGLIMMSSGIFEFKLLCVVDWVGTGVGLMMAMTGMFVIFGAL